MSTRALSWAIQQRTGTATRKVVLLLLADLADESSSCYPGREYLAERAELSVRAVQQALTDLAADGLIRVLRRARRSGGRRSNRYLILVDGPDTALPEADDWSGEFAPDDDVSAGQGNSAPNARLAVDSDDAAGHSNSAPGAQLPDGNDPPGNSAAAAPLTVHDVHVSTEEKDPLGVDPKTSLPPPTSTGSGTREADPQEEDSRRIRVNQAARILRAATAGVAPDRLPLGAQAQQLVDRVIELLDGHGWRPGDVQRRLTAEPLDTATSVYAVLRHRLDQLAAGSPLAAAPTSPAPPLGPWCGARYCDCTTRRLVDAEQRPQFVIVGAERRPLWCPDCSGRS